MSGSHELDPDQQQTRHHQQKQELHHYRHENQISAGQMLQEKQLSHEELNGRLHSQVISDRYSQVSQEASLNRHSQAQHQTASANSLAPKSTRLEAVSEPPALTQVANLVSVKPVGEPSDAGDLDTLVVRSPYVQVSGSPNRVCRICNKIFSSGRALGGHMRVHGPFYTRGSPSSIHGVFHLATNLTQKQQEDNNGSEDEEEETASIVDVSEKELLADGRYEEASLSSGGFGDANLFGKNDYGDDEFSIYGSERGSLSFACNTEIAADKEEAMGSSNSTRKKGLLYKLRHNPKRSFLFTGQEFTLEARQAFMDLTTTGLISAEGVVCSECGKAFWSERALFGHMRCHPERQWRGVLPPESSLEQRTGAMARSRRKRALEAIKDMGNGGLEIKTDVKRDGADRAEQPEATIMETVATSPHMKEAAGKPREYAEEVDGGEAEVLQSKAGGKELRECMSICNIVEMRDFTPHWRTAGRRSRRRLVSKVGSGETSSDEPASTSGSISVELAREQELETPDCLILLAEAARMIEEGTKLHNSQLQLGTEEYADGSSLKVSRRGLEGSKKMDVAINAGDDQGEYTGEYEDEDTPPFGRRERLHKDLVASTAGGQYECTTCKKSFTTHQALGGHRASHKKTKGCFARTNLADFSGEHLLAEDELGRLGYVQEKDPLLHKKKKQQQQWTRQSVFKGHVCSICNRVFLTGQALGGHKRCHWAAEKPSETASVASTDKQPSLQSEEQSSKNIVEGSIDLNMPAPMDEDDEVGYGTADQLHLIVGSGSTESKEKDLGHWKESLETKSASALPWTVKDLLIGDTCTHASKKEIESRCRIDGIWGQHWPNNNIGVSQAQLPQQICALQSLVELANNKAWVVCATP